MPRAKDDGRDTKSQGQKLGKLGLSYSENRYLYTSVHYNIATTNRWKQPKCPWMYLVHTYKGLLLSHRRE